MNGFCILETRTQFSFAQSSSFVHLSQSFLFQLATDISTSSLVTTVLRASTSSSSFSPWLFEAGFCFWQQNQRHPHVSRVRLNSFRKWRSIAAYTQLELEHRVFATWFRFHFYSTPMVFREAKGISFGAFVTFSTATDRCKYWAIIFEPSFTRSSHAHPLTALLIPSKTWLTPMTTAIHSGHSLSDSRWSINISNRLMRRRGMWHTTAITATATKISWR